MKDSREYDDVRRYSMDDQKGCSVLSMILLFLCALMGMGIAYLFSAGIYALFVSPLAY